MSALDEEDLVEWLQDLKRIPDVDDMDPQEKDTILANMFSLPHLMSAVLTPKANVSKLDEVLLAICMFDDPKLLEEESVSEDDYQAFIRENITLFGEANRRVGCDGEFCLKYLIKDDK